MHIPLFIQNIVPFIFIAIIALPLPILVLATPAQHLYEKAMRFKYYRMVKKHVENPYNLTEEKLHILFPSKTEKQLEQIAYYLEEDFVYSAN
jgi:hypothetical protein